MLTPNAHDLSQWRMEVGTVPVEMPIGGGKMMENGSGTGEAQGKLQALAAGIQVEEEADPEKPPTSIERALSTSTTSTEPGSLISSSSSNEEAGSPSSSTSHAASSPQTPIDSATVPSPTSLHTLSSASFQTLHPPFAASSTDTDRNAQRKLRRLCALLELVDTEVSYAADLHILVRVFFAELATLPFFSNAPTGVSSSSSSAGTSHDAHVGSRRLDAVVRNAEDLLVLHTRLAAGLQSVVREAHITAASPGQLIDKACSVHAEAAVYTIAEYWRSAAPALSSAYQHFSSQHGEALAVLREAERRSAEWSAYERRCAELMREQRTDGFRASPPSERSAASSRRASTALSSPAMVNDAPLSTEGVPSMTALKIPVPPSPSLRPSHPTRQDTNGSERPRLALHMRDYLIKPVQRICLLPLMLDAIAKYTLPSDPCSDELRGAAVALKKATAEVDDAGRRRECWIMSRAVAARLETAPMLEAGAGTGAGQSPMGATQNSHLTSAVLAQLGAVSLAGTLDVLHHHASLAPLTMPLRFRYYGAFVYESWILFAKVQTRRPHAFEPRHWFPLWAVTLDPMDARDSGGSPDQRSSNSAHSSSSHRPSKDGLLPHSFRLSCRGHHFELAASTAAEKALWVRTLTAVIQSAALAPPSSTGLNSFPSNLQHGGSMRLPGAGAFWTGGAGSEDEGGSVGDVASGSRTPSDPLADLEAATAQGPDAETQSIALRLPAPSHRNAVDRYMLLSQPLLAARNALGGGGVGLSIATAMPLGGVSGPSSPVDAVSPSSISSPGGNFGGPLSAGGTNAGNQTMSTWHWQRQNSVPAMLNRLGSSNNSVSVKLQRRRSFVQGGGGDEDALIHAHTGHFGGSSGGNSPRPSPDLMPVRIMRSRTSSAKDITITSFNAGAGSTGSTAGAASSSTMTDESWRSTFRRRSRRTSTLVLTPACAGGASVVGSRAPYDSPLSSAQPSPVLRRDMPLPALPWDPESQGPGNDQTIRRPASPSRSRPPSVRAFTGGRPSSSGSYNGAAPSFHIPTSSAGTVASRRPTHERSRSSASVMVLAASVRDAFVGATSAAGRRARTQSADYFVGRGASEEVEPVAVLPGQGAEEREVMGPELEASIVEPAGMRRAEEDEEADETFVSVPASPAEAFAKCTLDGGLPFGGASTPAETPLSLTRSNSNSLYTDCAPYGAGDGEPEQQSNGDERSSYARRAASISGSERAERRRSIGGSLREVRKSVGSTWSSRRGSIAESFRSASGVAPVTAPAPAPAPAPALLAERQGDSTISLPLPQRDGHPRRARSFMGIPSSASSSGAAASTAPKRFSAGSATEQPAGGARAKAKAALAELSSRSSKLLGSNSAAAQGGQGAHPPSRDQPPPVPSRRSRTLTLSRLLGPHGSAGWRANFGAPSVQGAAGGEEGRGAGGAGAGDGKGSAAGLLSPVEEGGEGAWWGRRSGDGLGGARA